MNKKTNKRKTLFYVTVAISILLISVAFVTSKTYTQLAISSLLYPLLIYFALKYYPNKDKTKSTKKLVLEVKTKSKIKKEPVEIVDIDKRAFLKMIGAAGFSFFIFSLITRKVEDLILNRNLGGQPRPLGGPDGDLAPAEPTEGYRVTEIETEDFNYYGFLNKEGNWYIMREDPTVGSFRYVKGERNFSKNWSKNKILKYDYFHDVFN